MFFFLLLFLNMLLYKIKTCRDKKSSRFTYSMGLWLKNNVLQKKNKTLNMIKDKKSNSHTHFKLSHYIVFGFSFHFSFTATYKLHVDVKCMRKKKK